MELSKAYEPQSVEDKWYQFWLDGKFFIADEKSPKPGYSIVIPPPNVTGVLTMGHVLNNTIQDILARKARMDGKEVLWLPGTDHAGIATQNAVEKALKKAGEIKHRDDLGREAMVAKIWDWKEKYGGIIIQQLKKLGASCDWSRERFTMDGEYSRCVQRVFVDLYKKGLIYRGKRMVNWCPASLTALSDEEVVMKEQKGFLYYFKVEVAEEVGRASSLSNAADRQDACPTFLTIATTRPETIPGDTAVAVNPKDPRYAHLIGKHVVRPLPAELPREQKLIPIIGDEHVDFEFGTGVLKVTPAHDKADFEIGARHKLPAIEVIEADGKMSDAAGADLRGLDRFKARKVAVEKLTELGALEKEEPYTNNVGYSERADVPIEPRLSEQWFLKYPSVEKARDCVAQEGGIGLGGTGYQPVSGGNLPPDSAGRLPAATGRWPVPPGKMQFHPQRWAKVYDHWMGGIQDWCISRQLWWGHRIPVWHKRLTVPNQPENHGKCWWFSELEKVLNKDKDYVIVRIVHTASGSTVGPFQTKSGMDNNLELNEQMDAGKSEHEFDVFVCTVDEQAVKYLVDEEGFTQDPDVLDTWFSSWLWPFATMGWPEPTETLKKFYPTTDLVTGPDIIFFWVARMIMAGYEYMNDPKFGLPDAKPFQNVYFSGIVRDKQGRKMSKSLGNSPDPLDLITKFGADALRFGVMRVAPLGQDILFDEQNVELGRNFCNKLWNACRFRLMVGTKDEGRMMNDETGASPGTSSFSPHTSSFPVQGEIEPSLLSSDDKWILLKLDAAIREVTIALNEYKFSEATTALYRFFWSEYCDWYVEASKAVLRPPAESSPSPLGGERAGVRGQNVAAHEAEVPPHPNPLPPAAPGGEGEAKKANTLAVIDFVLSHTLRLFHPFLPFITEELWHGMGYATDLPDNQGGKTIMFAPWPMPLGDDFKGHYGLDDCYLKIVGAKYELVTQGRNLRREANISAAKKIRYVLKPVNYLPPHDIEVIRLLLNAEAVEVNENYLPAKGTLTARTELGELYLPLEGLRSAEELAVEKARLTKELEKIEAEISKVEAKLANPSFTQKAPPQVLLEHQQRLAEWQVKRDQVKAALDALNG
jgi:valyl-tRNA synthetase